MGCCYSSQLPSTGDLEHNAIHVKIQGSKRQATIQLIEQRYQIMKYGYPTTDNLFQYEGHILAYSNFFKCPLWVCERVTKANLRNKRVDRTDREDKFERVCLLPNYFASDNPDYRGYDRGHMAAAGNHQHSPTAHADTFQLNNICPQSGELNRGLWNDLEKHARDVAWQRGECHILTGPLFLAPEAGYFRSEKSVDKLVIRRIGNSGVALPSHFYKVILSPIGKAQCYILPNRDGLKGSIDQFQVPLQEVEKKAAFRVFHRREGRV
eukprot:sb/3468291/